MDSKCLEKRIINGNNLGLIRLKIEAEQSIEISLIQSGLNYYHLNLTLPNGDNYSIKTKSHEKEKLSVTLNQIETILHQGCILELSQTYKSCNINGIE